jgi:hypothetical protein
MRFALPTGGRAWESASRRGRSDDFRKLLDCGFQKRTPFVETRAEKKRQRQNAARAMEEAALPRTGGERRAALDATEQREETAMRVEHAAQVERLQRRLVMEALGVRGGSSDEVRPKWYPQPKLRFRTRADRADRSRDLGPTFAPPRSTRGVSDARKH